VHAQGSQFTKDTPLPQEGWESAIERVAKKILQDQSPKCAMEVRASLYELMAACLPADFILKELLNKLIIDQRDDKVKQGALAAAAHFESTLRQGSKEIFHLEAFVLRFMADLKASLRVADDSNIWASASQDSKAIQAVFYFIICNYWVSFLG